MLTRSARVRAAEPLLHRFMFSRYCPPELRRFAVTMLPALASGLCFMTPPELESLDWGLLDPDAFAGLALEAGGERGFVMTLLEVTEHFYGWLAASGALSQRRARDIRHRIAMLSLSLALEEHMP